MIEVFFDGGCPLCRREINLLRRWDRRGKIRFTGISSPDFQAAEVGQTEDVLMARMHRRLPDGTWLQGVEVFRRMYVPRNSSGNTRVLRLTVFTFISPNSSR